MREAVVNYLAIFVLPLAVVCCGCSRSTVLSPSEFTAEVADALQKAIPSLKIEVVKDLELKWTSLKGTEQTSFLDNTYDIYKHDPAAKKEAIQRLVSALVEVASYQQERFDRTKIVPVIKDRPWLEESQKALLAAGAKKFPEVVYDDFNTDLIILYAEESDKTIRYLTPDDLKEKGIDRKELRALSVTNLKNVLPKIELHGANGVYMVTAGGTYEASLLVLDSIWKSDQIKVSGDIVVGIPTRDLLIVTGSENRAGLDTIKQIVDKEYHEGSYRLTAKLFVYRKDTFVTFDAR